MGSKVTTEKNLTPEELKRQREASFNMRAGFTNATKMFLDDIGPKNYDKIGILLSGGVDSTTLLWAMLKLGVRPHVITYTTSLTEKMSTDHKKAQELADHYNLPITVVNMPNDPDYVAQTIERLFSDHLDCWRKTRPDKEVAYLIHEMGQAALKSGIRYLFSGIGEENIHKLGRKKEIQGRYGNISDIEVALAMVSWDSGQGRGFSRMLQNMGIRFVLPHLISSTEGHFSHLSWDELNRPRKKEATLVAYDEEIKISGINPQVSPMQSGNSGAREYFETMVSTSQYATKFVGRPINTTTMFYNALENRYRPTKNDGYGEGSGRSNFELDEKFAWAMHVEKGKELPDQFKESLGQFIDLDAHEARHPEQAYGDNFAEEVHGSMTSVDLFNIMDDEEVDEDEFIGLIPEEDGSFTKKIDCFGYPLYIESARRDCPYAMAGKCSKFEKDQEPKDYKKCSSYFIALGERADLLRMLNDAYSIENGAYARAADWVEQESERLRMESEKCHENL